MPHIQTLPLKPQTQRVERIGYYQKRSNGVKIIKTMQTSHNKNRHKYANRIDTVTQEGTDRGQSHLTDVTKKQLPKEKILQNK